MKRQGNEYINTKTCIDERNNIKTDKPRSIHNRY